MLSVPVMRSKLSARSAPFVALSWLLVACGSDPGARPAQAERPHGHHHGHHGHDHSDPSSLGPLMRALFGEMGELRDALAQDDGARAARHARAIAVACDDQDVHEVDAERFGPRFAELDRTLHETSAALALTAEEGSLDAARALRRDARRVQRVPRAGAAGSARGSLGARAARVSVTRGLPAHFVHAAHHSFCAACAGACRRCGDACASGAA